MKKIVLILLIAITGCNAIQKRINPTFEHIVNKKSTIPNPTFTVHVITTSGYDVFHQTWLAREIENALLAQRITVLVPSPLSTVTTTTTRKSLASKDVEAATAAAVQEEKDITAKSIYQTRATYVIQAVYDDYSFKIIQVENQEIVASGIFTGDIKNNITVLLEKMNIR